MRLNFPRAFYLPKTETLTPVDCAGTDAEVWTYGETPKFGVIAFHGRANKPDFHFTYRTEAARAAKIAEYLDGRKRTAAFKAEIREARKAPHTLTVGTILNTSWGYDQTNVEFYEVTRIVGAHTVELREIAQKRTETGWLCGQTTPVPGEFIGEPFTRRVIDGGVAIEPGRSYRHAHVTDLKPGYTHYWSAYA